MYYTFRKEQRVKAVYGKTYRQWTTVAPGSVGVVKVVPRGPGPRNYGVLLDDGRKVVIPWGNLRAV